MYIFVGLASGILLGFFQLDHLATVLLLSTVMLALAHVIFIVVSSNRRSRVYRYLAATYGFDFTEAQAQPWTLIAIDPVKGDAPFIWRTVSGSLNGSHISFSDVELSGAILHPWWYRSVPSFSMKFLGFFGVSVATMVSIGGRSTVMSVPFSPWVDNAFASQRQMESALLKVRGMAVPAKAGH